MLDTDICSYAIKQSNVAVQRRLQSLPVEAVCVSVITKAELLYGLALRATPEKHRPAMEKFLQYMQVFDYPEAAASHYAEIRAALKRAGQIIGSNDLLIAAHARSLGLVLVSNNVREFGRVPGLRTENWALTEEGV